MSIRSTFKFIAEVVENFLFTPKIRLDSRSKLNSIYDFDFIDDLGNKIDLSNYKGKKLLIVNTASECRYTRQYDDLENLYKENSSLVNVVAIPCNDFGQQEKGTIEQINEFCKINYGVTFKVMNKSRIKRSATNSMFYWLTNSEKNGWNSMVPLWNFWKFLIDEEGKLIAVMSSRFNPNSAQMKSLLKV